MSHIGGLIGRDDLSKRERNAMIWSATSGPDTVHDQADDTDAPAGGVPLRLDGEETVTRKERRPDIDPASV
jgi:hypothetical protein